ncbi:MAG: helix-turn-helix domain-containing protein, partial [Bacteroidota bacterium]
MGKAVPMAMRYQIIAAYEAGKSPSNIARSYSVSRSSVYNLVNSYKSAGKKGLRPKYDQCGKKQPDASSFIYRA